MLMSASCAQAEPLQQDLLEEVADRRRALHRAAAHLLLQQDGDEAGHDAGGEWERRQAALHPVPRLHAVSVSSCRSHEDKFSFFTYT